MKGGFAHMKGLKKYLVIMTFLLMGIVSTAVYAGDQTSKEEYNVKVETIVKDGKTIEYLSNEDGNVRITQPNKIHLTTFESKINLMGQTKKGTTITIEIYNSKENAKSEEPIKTYEVGTVGVTGTFNQLIELAEGENRIVVIYANSKEKMDDEMIFYITREPEESKKLIKEYIVFPSGKNI